MSSLTEIVEHMLTNAKTLDEYASANGIPSASFDYDAFTNVPPDLQDARCTLINSAEAVRKLAMGPAGIATELLFNVRQAFELSRKDSMTDPKSRPTSQLYASCIFTGYPKLSHFMGPRHMPRSRNHAAYLNSMCTAIFAMQWQIAFLLNLLLEESAIQLLHALW